MDFGLVEPSKLQEVNHTLPEDGHQTAKILNGSSRSEHLDIRTGMAKWGIKEWSGKLYNHKAREADFLSEYTKHFDFIEMNAVFYSIPRADLIRKWKQMVDKNAIGDFLFMPKFSRQISHIKRLANAESETELFLSNIKELGPYLGPCFLQMSDNFPFSGFDALKAYLEKLPRDMKFFLELRHESWFGIESNRKAMLNLLADLGIGLVICDTSGRRDLVHMELTIPEVFIRFNGNNIDYLNTNEQRIDAWVERLKTYIDKGIEKIYFSIQQPNDCDSPALAKYAIEQFNLKLGATIPEILWKEDADNVKYETSLIQSKDGYGERTSYTMQIVKDDEDPIAPSSDPTE
jgi:uncharacterized protein YecE (DUF72 family)